MTNERTDNADHPTRRDMLRGGLRGLGAVCLGALGAGLVGAKKIGGAEQLWQLDPYKCIQCGHCATHCVLAESAVKCVHSFPLCGYCDFCTGYFEPECADLTTAAENQLCPTGALVRRKVEPERFEYTIDPALCIGCGKCVKGCTAFGNGSLYLQVVHDRCVNCNECAIAVACPSRAFRRVDADHPYLLKVHH